MDYFEHSHLFPYAVGNKAREMISTIWFTTTVETTVFEAGSVPTIHLVQAHIQATHNLNPHSHGDCKDGIKQKFEWMWLIANGSSLFHVRNTYLSQDRLLADLRCTDPRDDKIRIERRKGAHCEIPTHWELHNTELRRWRHEDPTLLRVKGDPSKGKTMLLRDIVDRLKG